MSRRKPVDNSAAVSLFPFLAVLLCTMGALLVVLVAVSRAAREAALRQAEAQQQLAPQEDDPAIRRELEKIDQFQDHLKQVRSQAEQKLREDQLRMGALESHMRRLQDQLALLHAATLELQAMEEEHYDDREQAQREIERLERLVAETKDEVEKLKDEMKSDRHKYALVPYEGPNGTFRRPIYIECRKDELILQPEGVRVKREDLYPPFGAGNPLAAALRAARNYYVQLHPGEGRSRDTEPYPLLVVRPAGLYMYDRARRAIQSADLDFGFELVEEDWELEYHAADPHLATLEQQAIEQARIRQQALAAAAPRAYRHGSFNVAGQLDGGDGGNDEFRFWDAGDGDEGQAAGDDAFGYGDAGAAGLPSEESHQQHAPGDGTSGGDAAAPGAPALSASAGDHEISDAGGDAEAGGHSGAQSGGAGAAGGAADQTATAAQSASTAGSSTDGSLSDPSAGQQATIATGSSAHDPSREAQQPADIRQRGRDWALDRKKPNAVPIRRNIHVVVRQDHVAILPESVSTSPPARSKRIELPGDTAESVDEFVAAVRGHVDGWGIAGKGLYWKPVLILSVGRDGRHRAADLNRLLQNSGYELRPAETANPDFQERSRATR